MPPIVRILTPLRQWADTFSPRHLFSRRRLCGISFSLLYGPGARWYTRFADWLFVGEWTHWQNVIVPLLPEHGTILELGCGDGELARRHADRADTWIAVDNSRAMLSVAARRPTGVNIRFVRADIRSLPISSHRMEIVISTFPAGFVLDARTWNEIERVLKPSGQFAIVMTGRPHNNGAFGHWRALLLAAAYGKRQETIDLRPFEAAIPSTLTVRWQWVPTANGEALVLSGQSAQVEVD